MTIEAARRPTRGRIDWRRAEFVLTALAFAGFLTLPIRVTIAYDGLPAHPLLLHVPVILIPLSVLGALACVVRPRWLERYGILLCLCSIVAMSSIFPTMQAGSALVAALHLSGRTAQLISQHSQAAHILAIVFVVFTAVLILNFSAHRISGGRRTGLHLADRLLAPRTSVLALRALLVLLALVSAFMVFRVGDLGAKAVWAGRIHQQAQGQPSSASHG